LSINNPVGQSLCKSMVLREFSVLYPVGDKPLANVSSLTLNAPILYLGKRGVMKEGKRFKIYLPVMYNDVWEELRGKKIKVYVVIDDKDEA
jgi:hypothetical protein